MTDMVLERIRAANPVQAREADYEELFRAIVATEGDPRLARRRLPRITGLRLVLLALIVFLALAGTATATYFVLRASHAITFPKGGSLTLFAGGTSSFDSSGAARIVTLAGGKQTTIWHCPGNVWCGEPVSFAWGPTGRRLAFTLDAIGGSSPSVGFHILNVVSGQDRVLVVGCFPAAELAWSPYGGRLAYSCGGPTTGFPSQIHVLRLRGSSDRTVPTNSDAFWPSWSRSGTRIAYSTQLEPTEKSGIYTVALDGSHRRLVARGGAAPAWSPDGRTIAYQTTCGIRLVTPAGRDVTPTATSNTCGAIGRPGPPVWSPDGTKLAVETRHRHGIYVMDKSGGALHWVSLGLPETRTWYRALPGRPSWWPIH
jgi:dipeptidyl aminopeptidase/acylaminoacyl peptidase